MTVAPPGDQRRAGPQPGPRCTPGALGGPDPSSGQREGPRAPRRSSSLRWAKVKRKPLPTSGGAGKPGPGRHPPPTPAPPPGPRDADKLGLPGDGGSRPNSEPLPAGPHPPAAQRLYWARGPLAPKLQAQSQLPGASDLHSAPWV